MNKKLLMKGLFIAVLSVIIATIFGSSASYAEAVITRGLYTDSSDVRWEWQKTINEENTEEPEQVSIMFYDKPAATTTIVVPSLSDVITAAGATPTLDTYYVKNADQESQAANFTEPSQEKRTSTADVTKLDMTNTSKVQIMGIQPILNPEIEAELVFGENMVIGNSLDTRITFTIQKCIETAPYDTWQGQRYRCARTETITIPDAQNIIPGWSQLTEMEQNWYYIWSSDILDLTGFTQYVAGATEDIDVLSGNYATTADYSKESNDGGVFAGYKLKLTGFNQFNYLGWYTFKNSVFSDDSTTVTINGDGMLGEGIFENTNIRKAIINSNAVGSAIFRNCSQLSEVEFSDNVTIVSPLAFVGTNLGTLDFSQTNIKTIMRGAFQNAHLSSVGLDGVEKIDYEAFADNDLTELVLPKTIKNMNSARMFAGNRNLTKLTVAYDTLHVGAFTPLHAAIGEWVGDSFNVANNIKELTILAPYDTDEEVDEGHILYEDYPSRVGKAGPKDLSELSVYVADEDEEANKYKNVISPGYFAYFGGVEQLNIGEGYEYIGYQAFYNYLYGPYRYNTNYYFDFNSEYAVIDKTFHVSLPETLKGIGGGAFAAHYDKDFEINLPDSLEFIGSRAFYNDYLMKNDVDLPNLRYIGNHAFFTTGIHNLYLHDKLEWVGSRPFQGCWYLHDITFDFDVFGPNSHLFSTYTIYGQSNGNGNFSSSIFGHPTTGYPVCKTSYGYDENCNKYYNEDEWTLTGWGNGAHKLGTITFTENASTTPGVMRIDNPASGLPNNWFYDIAATKIDLEKTGWTELSAGAFQFSAIDKVVLPEGLEKIWGGAFYGTRITEELTIPESVVFIGGSVFNNHASLEANGIYSDGHNYYSREGELLDRTGFESRRYLTPEDHEPCELREEWGNMVYYGPGCHRDNWDGTYYYQDPYGYSRGVKITKLPDNLEYVGMGAFYADDRIEADLTSANLDTIGEAAFHGTSLRNITIPENVSHIGKNAFVGINNINNIIIDANIFAALEAGYQNNAHDNYQLNYGENGLTAVFNQLLDSLDVELNVNRIVLTDKVVNLPEVETFEVQRQASCPYGEWNEFYCKTPNGNIDDSFWRYSRVLILSSLFYGLTANEIDLSEVNLEHLPANSFNGVKAKSVKLPNTLTSISDYAFYAAEVEEPVEVPSRVTTIGTEAFQYSNISFANAFAEGLEDIKRSAFYGADIHGDIVIPDSVQHIGFSAFNAGDADTHYKTVTIKPELNYGITDNQAIFQMFWNAKMDKLVIESPMLPVLRASMNNPILPHDLYSAIDDTTIPGFELREDGEPEFHGMTMREVEITALPEITANAFEECANLEKVVFLSNRYLNRISHHAFNNATKLKQVVFGEENNDIDINLHEYAFNNTAIESLGITDDTGMNLAAANFRTANEHVFSNMTKLKTVSIPNNFNIDESLANTEKNTNGSHITSFTFADDPELNEVTIGYQVSEIRDGAFLNDEKLAKLFVWGNAEIQESDDLIQDFNNTTIPKGTTIFAYSDAPAEAYANAESRNDYDGKFYALDEVLYLTSNKSKVLLEQDEEGNNTGFDKTGLKLYGLRRDGVILESDWQNYNTAFSRTNLPDDAKNISFEEGRGALGPDDAAIAATVFDAPKPFNAISLANENFANVDYEFVAIASNNNPLIVVHYPDGYTGNIRNTTLISTTVQEIIEDITDPGPEEELEVPDTGSYGALIGAATSSVSIATIIVLGGIYIRKKRN